MLVLVHRLVAIRFAAARPALSPSKSRIKELALASQFSCVFEVAVPSSATAFGKPACISLMAAKGHSTTMIVC